MTNALKRRDFLRASAAALGVGILAACQPKVVEKEVTRIVKEVVEEVATAKPAEEAVEISWARHGADTDLKEEDLLSELFTERYPNITLKPMVLPWDDYNTKIPVMMAGGTAPDTFGAHPALLMEVYNAEGLVLVEDHIEAAEPDLDYDDVVYHGDAEFEGHIVGLPQKSCTHQLRYNSDIFEGAGLPTPGEIYWDEGAEAWNWERFIEMGKEITKDLDGDDQPDQYFFDGMGGTLILSTIRSAGGEIFDEQITKCILTQDEAKKGIRFIGDLVVEYGIQPPPEIKAGELGITFTTGRIAVGGATTCDSVRDLRAGHELPFKWDFVVPPAGSAGVRVWGDTDQIIISSSSKHVDEAFEWMVYRSSREAWEDTYGKGIMMAFSNGPTRWSIFESKAFTEPLGDIDMEMIKEGYKQTIPNPFVPRCPQPYRVIFTVMTTEVDNVLRGAKSVDQAAADMCELIDQVLEEGA